MNYKVLRKAISLCWAILAACFIIKALGGNWFATTVTSPLLDVEGPVRTVSAMLSSSILFTFYYLAVCEKKSLGWKAHVLTVCCVFAVTLLKLYVLPPNFYLLLDCVLNFIVPAILILCIVKPGKDTSKYLRIPVAFCMNSGFQTVSTLVRQLSTNVVITNSLAALLLGIDVLIMLILYWLYSLLNKRRETEMGVFFTLLMGKGTDELNSMLADVNAKLEKDPGNSKLIEEKSEIEKALAEK